LKLIWRARSQRPIGWSDGHSRLTSDTNRAFDAREGEKHKEAQVLGTRPKVSRRGGIDTKSRRNEGVNKVSLAEEEVAHPLSVPHWSELLCPIIIQKRGSKSRTANSIFRIS
jgi:hypothetical protein